MNLFCNRSLGPLINIFVVPSFLFFTYWFVYMKVCHGVHHVVNNMCKHFHHFLSFWDEFYGMPCSSLLCLCDSRTRHSARYASLPLTSTKSSSQSRSISRNGNISDLKWPRLLQWGPFGYQMFFVLGYLLFLLEFMFVTLCLGLWGLHLGRPQNPESVLHWGGKVITGTWCLYKRLL